MLKLYYHPSPNPAKVALYLEETNTPYEIIVADTRKGDQHTPEFRAINPNGKTPVLVDGDIKVFDSNAIMLYLGEKIGKFMPANTLQAHAELYSWLMFVATGIGPYCGQAVHFKHFAPEPKEYAINRYDFEAWRHWLLIEERLSKQPYMLSEYSIVDMSVWGWARAIPFVLGDNANGTTVGQQHGPRETTIVGYKFYRIMRQAVYAELSSKNSGSNINESIENKIDKSISTGSAVNLMESKTYENPQFLRMKDIMSKIIK